MPAFCGVIGCGHRSNRDEMSFYRFPALLHKGSSLRKSLNEERRKKWLLSIRRADLNENKLKWLRVCQDHFITGQPADLLDVDHPDWVPSLKMGYDKRPSKSPKLTRVQRQEQPQKRATIISLQIDETSERNGEQICDTAVQANEIFQNEQILSDHVEMTENSICCQTGSISKQCVETQTNSGRFIEIKK